jgi:3-oxoacyl-[acyl-carrier-protein] synthase-3
MTRVPFGILGTGSATPERVLANDELERMVDTSDEWITQRTGIKERRVVAEGESTSDLAIAAARRALEAAQIDADELDMIIMATVSPDNHVPSTACKVQSVLGARRAAAFDLNAGCTGFIYATNVAAQYLWGGSARKVLVIGGECLTRITNYSDRSSCILFGDAAGAVIYGQGHEYGEVLSTKVEADGDGYDVMIIPSGGSRKPMTHEGLDAREDKLIIHGREVYKFAVSRMVDLVRGEMAANPGVEFGAVIPHQVNMRILEAARERLDLPSDHIYTNIERFGNTSAGSVPLALDEARRSGFLDDKSGKLVVMCAFGAGLTWGSVGLRW